MPKLKATTQETALRQIVSNVRYYCCINHISTQKRCTIMKYSPKTDRRRMGTDNGSVEGDGKFEVEQLAAFAAAVRIPLYNLFAPLKPEDLNP